MYLPTSVSGKIYVPDYCMSRRKSSESWCSSYQTETSLQRKRGGIHALRILQHHVPNHFSSSQSLSKPESCHHFITDHMATEMEEETQWSENRWYTYIYNILPVTALLLRVQQQEKSLTTQAQVRLLVCPRVLEKSVPRYLEYQEGTTIWSSVYTSSKSNFFLPNLQYGLRPTLTSLLLLKSPSDTSFSAGKNSLALSHIRLMIDSSISVSNPISWRLLPARTDNKERKHKIWPLSSSLTYYSWSTWS